MTREKFRDAVSDTIIQWNEKASEHDMDAASMMTMAMQNVCFSAMLENNLFGDENKEDK